MESVSGAARRPCFIDEDDGLAWLADMEAGFSGSHHPFYSRPMCFARRSGSFRNVSPAMASFSSSSSFSPRSGRFCDARFEEHHQPHFLDACFLCKKPLGDNRDIFMYSHSLRSLFSLVSPPPFPLTLPSLLSPICLPRDSAISLVPIISLFSLIYLPRDSAISLFSLISNTHSISIRILKTLHLFQSIHSPLSHTISLRSRRRSSSSSSQGSSTGPSNTILKAPVALMDELCSVRSEHKSAIFCITSSSCKASSSTFIRVVHFLGGRLLIPISSLSPISVGHIIQGKLSVGLFGKETFLFQLLRLY